MTGFAIGDRVKVVDPNHLRYEQEGIITAHDAVYPRPWLVDFSGGTDDFHAWQLMGVDRDI